MCTCCLQVLPQEEYFSFVNKTLQLKFIAWSLLNLKYFIDLIKENNLNTKWLFRQKLFICKKEIKMIKSCSTICDIIFINNSQQNIVTENEWFYSNPPLIEIQQLLQLSSTVFDYHVDRYWRQIQRLCEIFDDPGQKMILVVNARKNTLMLMGDEIFLEFSRMISPYFTPRDYKSNLIQFGTIKLKIHFLKRAVGSYMGLKIIVVTLSYYCCLSDYLFASIREQSSDPRIQLTLIYYKSIVQVQQAASYMCPGMRYITK